MEIIKPHFQYIKEYFTVKTVNMRVEF